MVQTPTGDENFFQHKYRSPIIYYGKASSLKVNVYLSGVTVFWSVKVCVRVCVTPRSLKMHQNQGGHCFVGNKVEDFRDY